MGEDWGRRTAAYTDTCTFRERVLGDTSGSGTTGIDDSYAAAYLEGTAAEDVLAEATQAGGGRDVRVGGGVSTARAFLRADLVDHLHVAISRRW